MDISTIHKCFHAETISVIDRYMDQQVADIPNDPLPMWYIFRSLYSRYNLSGDDLIAFTCRAIGKALNYGSLPVRVIRLRKKSNEEKYRHGFVLCTKCGKSKNDISIHIVNVWNSFGENKEFLMNYCYDKERIRNGTIKREDADMMNNFLWGFRFALPEDLTDISMIDPDDLTECENDIWGI